MANITLEQTLRLCLQTVKEYVGKVRQEINQDIQKTAKVVILTQEEYDSLTTIDAGTIYIIS